MKRSREIILWAFFLALCFWAGYLKGYLPLSIKQGLFVRNSFQILNAAPFDFPRPFITALESEIGQKVEIRRVRSWDELQAQLVIKGGPNLLFAPAHWAADLANQDLTMRLNPIESQIENRLSPDFISLQGKNLVILPLFWTVTEFRVPASDFPEDETLTAVLANKMLAEVHLFPDTDLIVRHLKTWSSPSVASPLKLKDVEGFNFKNVPKALPKNSLWEVPQHADIPGSRALKTEQAHALMVYGIMIPRNSSNRKLSYRSLERILEPALTEIALKQLPLGTTLKDSEGELKISKRQRSNELRELKLHDVILLDKRDPIGYQELLPRYNFIF